MIDLKLLISNKFFKELDFNTLINSLPLLAIENYDKNQMIFLMSFPSDYYYIVLEGKIGLFLPKPIQNLKQIPDPSFVENNTIIKYLFPGDYLQKSNEFNRKTSCFAIEKSILIKIRWNNAEKLVKQKEKLDFFQEKQIFGKSLFGDMIINFQRFFFQVEYSKNSCIFIQNEPVDNLYLIEKGEIELISKHSNEKIRIAILTEGSIFGEELVFNNEKRRFTAISHLNSIIWGINQMALKYIFDEIPNLENHLKEKLITFENGRKQLAESLKEKLKLYADKQKSKYNSIRTTVDDIDRIAKTAIQSLDSWNKSPQKTVKINVKSFVGKEKLCFFRAKRVLTENSNSKNFYEIDDSEKKLNDRGKNTDFLKEIINKNVNCLNFLIKKAKTLTRAEILAIFDREKFIINENRKNLKKKYEDKEKRITSATTFKMKTLENRENHINFHIKRPKSSERIGFAHLFKSQNYNKIDISFSQKKNNDFGMYEKMKEMVLIGRKKLLFPKNTNI